MTYKVHSNCETFIPADKLGRNIPPYRKTYEFPGEFINAEHEWWSTCPVTGSRVGVRPRPRNDKSVQDRRYDVRDVFGSLRREDALKLYEMAFFCEGNIIELGTSYGLSCSIMCQALEAAGNSGLIDTVDLDLTSQRLACKAISALPGHQRVRYHTTDGGKFLREYAARGETAVFAFIDHAHSYEPVREAASLLDAVIGPGGFVLFHDYNDWRNSDPADPAFRDRWSRVDPDRLADFSAYGVYSAVHDGLSEKFQFHGVFGCTGLFRKLG